MAGDLSKPGALAILSGTAMPTTLYVKGHVGDPGDSGTANAAAETTRKAVTLGTPSAGAGYYEAGNTTLVEWLNAAANETWSHITLWSASSGGTCWFVDDCTNVVVVASNTITIDVGALTVRFPFWV